MIFASAQKASRALLRLIVVSTFSASALHAADDYQPGPDSKPQEGVPKGEVLKFTFDRSKIFPGTTREYWIYVPKQYDPARPACVYVNQDGVQYNAPVVFDNLIHRGEMPVTIGIFIMHGRVKALQEGALDRFNRSYEYDGLGDNYARFLLEELLPDAETKSATDGRPVRLSKSGNDRAIGGASSGAVCAFTAAWERPDAFSRVFSSIGTYVGLRGANEYPTLARKFEPKPIRVFLQDGSNDLNIYGGDWWMANQELERALTFAGYEVSHVWGEGGHNHKHATAIFPDAMRWLWKDWPAPVKAGAGSPQLREILIPGEEWQLVGDGFESTTGAAVNARGEVFFNDTGTSKTYRVPADGKPVSFVEESGGARGQAFGPDGHLYACATTEGKVVAHEPNGTMHVVSDGVHASDVAVRHDGAIYVTEPVSGEQPASKLWLITLAGEKRLLDSGPFFGSALVFSPDQSLLYGADANSHWIYSYQIQADGLLAHKQRYFHLHVPDNAEGSGAGGLAVDRDGRLYVATYMGIQVCDQAGRVNCINPTPNGRVSDVAFGGPEFDTLYATCGDKVFKRKLKVRGAPSFLPPVKPAPPRL